MSAIADHAGYPESQLLIFVVTASDGLDPLHFAAHRANHKGQDRLRRPTATPRHSRSFAWFAGFFGVPAQAFLHDETVSTGSTGSFTPAKFSASFRLMNTITAILEPDADGTVHVPLPAGPPPGASKGTATFEPSTQPLPPMALEERRGKIEAALKTLRDRGTFASIVDPVAWQRDIRQDRPLPGRD